MHIHRLALIAAIPLFSATGCGSKTESAGTSDSGEVGSEESDTDTDTDSDTDTDTDADTDTDTDTDEPVCTAAVTDTLPIHETSDWYWLDPLYLAFDAQPEHHEIFALTDADGNDVAFTAEWADNLEEVNLSPTGGLNGSTEYKLTVSCGDTTEVDFVTSEFGVPITVEDVDMLGRTYELNLPGAYFAYPAGVGALLGTYLESPLLVSVVATTETEITLVAAEGVWDDEGAATQDMDKGTFDLSAADWTMSPYFAADAERLVIIYKDAGGGTTDIPINNLHLEGTFNADATIIGGAWASGLADTRNMAPLLGLEAGDSVVCDYMETFGLPCLDCGEGDEYCVYMEAYFDDAPLLVDVILDPTPGESDTGE